MITFNTTFFTQNTAMHLAAINGHPVVVNFFLTDLKAKVLMNNDHENILDIAVKSEHKDVASVIARHDR